MNSSICWLYPSSWKVIVILQYALKGKGLLPLLNWHLLIYLGYLSHNDKSHPITGLDRPFGLQEVEGPTISRQSAQEGSKVVSHTHWLFYPPGDIPCTHYVRSWVEPRAIVRLEGLSQWKIPTTPPRIEPATFWLVVQCLYQLRYCIPPYLSHTTINIFCNSPVTAAFIHSFNNSNIHLLSHSQCSYKWQMTTDFRFQDEC
jgi:hypothetical protein